MKTQRKSHLLRQLVVELMAQPEQLVVVILKFFGGLTYDEIADRTGWRYWEVKKLIYAALSTIRDRWEVRLPERSKKSRPPGGNSSDGESNACTQ